MVQKGTYQVRNPSSLPLLEVYHLRRYLVGRITPVSGLYTPGFAVWTVLQDDLILADALELGPLQNRGFDLPEETIRRIIELTPKDVPVEASILLYKYYLANKADNQEYVLLPQQNFNAYFGSTSFSQKWVGALNGKLIEKKVLNGVCKVLFRRLQDN